MRQEGRAYSSLMRRRGVVFLLAAVAGVWLVASGAGASGGGQVEVVVASAGAPGCTGFVVESLSGARMRCIPFAGGDYQPGAAAADGSVVFVKPYTDGTGTTEVTLTELVHPNGSAVELYAPTDYNQVASASISADGSTVAFLFLGDSTNPTSIDVVNADGSGLRVVAPWEGAYLSAPAISPDGRSIAYWCSSEGPGVSYPPPRRCGPLTDGSYRRSGLMLMNADGTDKRIIVIGPGIDSPPSTPGPFSWSPNGRWLTMDGLSCGAAPCVPQVSAYRTDGSDLFNYLDPSRHVNHRQATREKVTGADVPQFCGSNNQILYESGSHTYLIHRNGTHRQRTAITTLHGGWPVCVPPPGGKGPPPTVNAMQVTVPRVRTLSYAIAKRRLRSAGLHVATAKRIFSARFRQGHVISQNPHAGVHLHRSNKQGPPVKLVLSRGPRP